MITATYDPAQWQLVPIEPTASMCRALFYNLCNADNEAKVIKAVIAAAPSAPAQPRNFCPDCGKRTPPDSVHTCTPPASEPAAISPDESADYHRGWKDGCKHGAWAAAPAAARNVMYVPSLKANVSFPVDEPVMDDKSLRAAYEVWYANHRLDRIWHGIDGSAWELWQAAIAATKGAAKP